MVVVNKESEYLGAIRLPAIGQEQVKIRSLHVIDPTQNISQIFNGIETIALRRSNQGEVNCQRFSAGVRAAMEKVLPRNHKCLDFAFTSINVQLNVRVLQKSCQCDPMIQRVTGGFCQQVAGRKAVFVDYMMNSELFHQLLRESSSVSPSLFRIKMLCFSFNLVEFIIYVEHQIDTLGVQVSRIKDLSPCVCVATCFYGFVKKSIESGCSISLNNSGEPGEELLVLSERKILRITEVNELVIPVASTNKHFCLSHFLFQFAILDFDLGFIGLNNFRLKDFASNYFVEDFQCLSCADNPIALGRTCNWKRFTCISLLLPVVWQSIIDFVDNYSGQQPWSSVASRNWSCGLGSLDDVCFAFFDRTWSLDDAEPISKSEGHFRAEKQQKCQQEWFQSCNRDILVVPAERDAQ